VGLCSLSITGFDLTFRNFTMHKFHILLFLIGSSVTVNAQYFAEGRVTYNTFDMKDMKALQKELFTDFPFQTKATSSFDPYVGFQLSAGTIFEENNFSWRTGVIIGYTSTGGRVGYSDYSGVVRGDQLLNLFSFGITGGIEKAFNDGKWTAGFELPLTYDLTNFTLKNELIIDGYPPESQQYKFKSEGLSVQPRINVFRNFSNDLSIGLSAGYHISVLNPDLVWKEDGGSTLTLQDSDEPLKAHWNGFRAGITLRYAFSF
jgi:hypothetical protein